MRRGELGGTLIEVLVSLLLVVVGLLGVYAAATASVRGTSHGQRTTQATARAERQLEILRNAPTLAITCLAAGTDLTTCGTTCCQNLQDGGVSGCAPSGDGGLAGVASCQLVPAPETDATGTIYTYQRPLVTADTAMPYLFDVQVRVDYTMPGEAMGGTDVRSVVLRTGLYKP